MTTSVVRRGPASTRVTLTGVTELQATGGTALDGAAPGVAGIAVSLLAGSTTGLGVAVPMLVSEPDGEAVPGAALDGVRPGRRRRPQRVRHLAPSRAGGQREHAHRDHGIEIAGHPPWRQPRTWVLHRCHRHGRDRSLRDERLDQPAQQQQTASPEAPGSAASPVVAPGTTLRPMNGAGTDSATSGGRTLILVRHAKSSWDLDRLRSSRPAAVRPRPARRRGHRPAAGPAGATAGSGALLDGSPDPGNLGPGVGRRRRGRRGAAFWRRSTTHGSPS